MNIPKVNRDIKYLIIHCAYTKRSMDIDVNDVRRWHKAKGWRDVGYNFYIKFDGTIQQGRDLLYTGAHTLGHNHDSIGVCLEGGMSEQGKPQDTLTVDQWKSVIKIYLEAVKTYPNILLSGHNQFNNKPCPSFDVREYADKHNIPCIYEQPFGV